MIVSRVGKKPPVVHIPDTVESDPLPAPTPQGKPGV